MGKSLLPSHFAVNPKYAKKIKSQKHMKGKKGAHIASQSGKRQGRCPRCRSEGGGAGVPSTVLLRGWRGRGTVHGDFWRDRGQGLCPQCLEEWGLQGYCVHSTSHSGRGRGAVSTVLLTVGCCVHSTSHSGRARGSCGARPGPPAPGGTGSGNAASCQAHRTASPFL